MYAIISNSKMISIKPGDFSFLGNPSLVNKLEDAYKAVTIAECWDWLADPDVPNVVDGFMFCDSLQIKKIRRNMKLMNSYSGESFSNVMRMMEFIAKHGWKTFVNDFRPKSKVLHR